MGYLLSEFDVVNRPSHYTQGKYECIEVMEDTLGKQLTIDFCLGNAFKYIYRCKHKGKMVEDLKKANWYITHALELMNNE